MLLKVVGTLRVPSAASKTHNKLATTNRLFINQAVPDTFHCLY